MQTALLRQKAQMIAWPQIEVMSTAMPVPSVIGLLRLPTCVVGLRSPCTACWPVYVYPACGPAYVYAACWLA